jgi:hypothetical protein
MTPEMQTVGFILAIIGLGLALADTLLLCLIVAAVRGWFREKRRSS